MGSLLAKYHPSINFDQFIGRLVPLRQEAIAKHLIENVPEANLKALDVLAKQGRQLMILTSRRLEAVTHLMDPKHHLGSRITHFYHLGNNPYFKPDPKTFAIIEAEHGLKPTDCVYVGDSLHDATAAKKAGLYFVANLESEILTKKDFDGHQVDTFINKLPEIVDAVDKVEDT